MDYMLLKRCLRKLYKSVQRSEWLWRACHVQTLYLSRQDFVGFGLCIMAAYRLNSVYDLTSLRLHPDGTRVLRPALGTAIRDTRGNLIASDAGGTGTAPRYRRVREDTGGESIDLDDAGSRPGTANTKRRRKVPKPRRGAVDAEGDTMGEAHQPGGRAQKRMKFDDDISFLEPGLSLAQYADFAGPPTLPSQEADASWFPLPSSVIILSGMAAALLLTPWFSGSSQVHTLLCGPIL